MSDIVPFAGEPANTHEAIMYATYSALQEYGYAELSIQRIANEVELSKSTLYHHFSNKDDLLLSFLKFLLDELEQLCHFRSTNDPRIEILRIINVLLGETTASENPSNKSTILATYIELRAQAIRNPKYREQVTKADQRLVSHIASLIETGIEQGEFQAVEPEDTAEFLVAILHGIILQSVTRNDGPLPQLHWVLKRYLKSELFAT